MKYYEDFSHTGDSFADRVGEPEEFDAAIGKIALGFSFLDDTARNLIVLLSGTDLKAGYIMAAQLSFRQKLDVLTSLVVHRLSASADAIQLREQVDELVRICRRAEELRNTYLHSSYSQVERAKSSIKGRHGIKVHREAIDAARLLDVADYIVYTGIELEYLPLMMKIADSHHSSLNSVSYMKDNRVVAVFKLGEMP